MGAGQWQHRAERQQRREAVEEAVVAAEHHRRAETGQGDLGAGEGVQMVLGLALRAQVVTGAAGLVGAERAHVQQPAHAAVLAGLEHLLRQLDVHVTEPLATVAALVEDADQVDHRVAIAEVALELVRIVDVGQHQQVAVALAPAREHAYVLAGVVEAGDYLVAGEAGAAEHAYGINFHYS